MKLNMQRVAVRLAADVKSDARVMLQVERLERLGRVTRFVCPN
jgi:hypothetical protein